MNEAYTVNPDLEIHDLGLQAFEKIHQLQKKWLEMRIQDEIPDRLILVEHPPVFTLGRKFQAQNLLDAQDIPVFQVERGGDISFHEPGQLVAYPIVKLIEQRRDISFFLRGLEEVIIQTLLSFQLPAQRDARNTGVWINGQKVASIGIAIRRWVTWHGLALNINNPLIICQQIQPCGFPAELMTSINNQSNKTISYNAVKEKLIEFFVLWWSKNA